MSLQPQFIPPTRYALHHTAFLALARHRIRLPAGKKTEYQVDASDDDGGSPTINSFHYFYMDEKNSCFLGSITIYLLLLPPFFKDSSGASTKCQDA